MLPPEEELVSDQDLREASIEQLMNLRSRVDMALQMRAGSEARGKTQTSPEVQPGPPLPGESPERPGLD